MRKDGCFVGARRAGEERRKVAEAHLVVESGDWEEEDEMKEEKGLEEVRWEKFLPRMPVRVLLVEGDDSTRQIIAALLRKCSYRGLLFLIFTPFVDLFVIPNFHSFLSIIWIVNVIPVRMIFTPIVDSLDCEYDSCPHAM